MRGSWLYALGGLAVGAITVALVLLPARLGVPGPGTVIGVPRVAAPHAVQLAVSPGRPGAWVHPGRRGGAVGGKQASAPAHGAVSSAPAAQLVSIETTPARPAAPAGGGPAARPSSPAGSTVAQAVSIRRQRLRALRRVITRPHPVRQGLVAARRAAPAPPAAPAEVNALADTLAQTAPPPGTPPAGAPPANPHRPGLQPQLLGLRH